MLTTRFYRIMKEGYLYRAGRLGMIAVPIYENLMNVIVNFNVASILDEATTEDRRKLLEEYGLKTILDLRTEYITRGTY